MAYLGDDYLGDDALTAPPIDAPGAPPDTGDPCDPNSSAYDPSQCGEPAATVQASDGSGSYTLPVQVFNSGLRYACVYADNSVQMLADADYSGVGSCPFQDGNVVKVWDVVNGVAVWSSPAPAPASSPSLLSIVQKILQPGGAPTMPAKIHTSLPGHVSTAGGPGLVLAVAALALIAFMSSGKKGRG